MVKLSHFCKTKKGWKEREQRTIDLTKWDKKHDKRTKDNKHKR